uniref:Cadherin-like protein n=1 Tax=Holotrichia parallela TaxID=93412 RepID=A0A0A7RYK5_HOLPA|nr:cadherin-like protein [Holotrichia parallela]
MHEEMEVPFQLGSIEYTGDKPAHSFTEPDRDANLILGLTISESSETSDLWILDITIQQDYENAYFADAASPYYFFRIDAGTEIMYIQLNIININDNNPMVSVNEPSCAIEENDDSVSTCTYTITDADGHMTAMTWTLEGYDDVFEFMYEEPVTDVKVKVVTLLLKPKIKLDYEQVALYIMRGTPSDSRTVDGDEQRSGTANVVVAVQDVADTDPVWTKIIAAEEFDELEAKTFTVVARDGDLGINDDIVHTTDGSWSQYISIGLETGVITVLPIDRDADQEIIYTFTITACEVMMETACVSQLVTFLVRDLNNQWPEITVDSARTTRILENTYQDLEFVISVNDRDMGENAMYDIELNSVDGKHLAFGVAPTAGYQSSSIYMYIVDYTMLDYDRDETWREFTITLTTSDRPDPQNSREVEFTIILDNINDEVPYFIFSDDEDNDNAYVANIPETIEINTFVKTVLAKDEDMYDSVKYSLLGTMLTYEFMEPFNTAIAQLTINVIDVNDETPRITVASQRIEIYENLDEGTIIVDEDANFLIATDDDQTAELEFLINWDNSYATKTGRSNSSGKIYKDNGCMEIVPANTPNCELFGILYMEVIAIDTNREINNDQVSLIGPIYILDKNDEKPVFVESTITSYKAVNEEVEEGTTIGIIIATDVDSDKIFYDISAIDAAHEGLVTINDLGELSVGGRIDADDPILYSMLFNVFASDGEHTVQDEIVINVNDINDNTPVFTSPTENENFDLEENSIHGKVVTATDGNGIINDARVLTSVFLLRMFVLTDIDDVAGTCILKANVDLQTYHGVYSIVVKATDLGVPPLSAEYTITVEIEKYNFYAPLFTFPTEGMTLYLRQDPALDSTLYDYNGIPVQDISATDLQNEKYSIIFDIPDSEVFTVSETGKSIGELRVLSQPTEDAYDLTITAVPFEAVHPLTASIVLHIQFLDMAEQPTFSKLTETIVFRENTSDQTSPFPQATYSLEVPEHLVELFPTYYLIVGADQSPFEIEDSLLNVISLNELLDREDQDTHIVQIRASRFPDGSAFTQDLSITDQLEDINDNPPHFEQLEYYSKISTTTSVGTSILRVQATDADIADKLTYHMDDYQNIPSIISSTDPFDIDDETGIITSNIEIPLAGEGFFLFTVRVNDELHDNYATIHIYMVSDAHRVDFVFRNDLATVTSTQAQIAMILESHFEYNVIIEQISPNTDDSGNVIESETTVQVYFVNSDVNEAIVKGTIEKAANDLTAFRSLSDRFSEYELDLVRFLENEETVDNTEQILKAWLIGVSIVLGTLCVLLLVVFILKTRSLTQRLNKLSVIRYGSQDSGLNRKVAPTTNKHAIEGSNPAYSEEKVRAPENDDAMSIGSGDSDLVGIENNPEFDYNYEGNNRNPRASREIPYVSFIIILR